MRLPLIVVLIVLLLSCAGTTVKRYEQLVDTADKIVISSRDQHDSIVITTAPNLQNMKEIFKRNIHPAPPHKFIVDRSIALYKAKKRIGILLVSYGEKPLVNFRSEGLNFAFPLTYGIGMSLSELSSENSR
jgi:hypothetical protein